MNPPVLSRGSADDREENQISRLKVWRWGGSWGRVKSGDLTTTLTGAAKKKPKAGSGATAGPPEPLRAAGAVEGATCAGEWCIRLQQSSGVLKPAH
jgi:hypothetical protein